jgi:ribose transport system permease protein
MSQVANDGGAGADAPPPAPDGDAKPADGGKSPLSGVLYLGQRAVDFDASSVFIATVAIVLIIGFFHHDFLQVDQLLNIAQQSVYIMVLAAGVAFLLSMREIDLSIGSLFGLCVVGGALLMQHGWNPWLAGLAAIGLGAAGGLFNALLVQAVSIPAIVATLGTLSVYRGLAQALSHGEQVVGLPVENSFFTFIGGKKLGVPTSVWITLVLLVILTAVLRLTPFGYRVRSIGSNPDAARFSGISIPRVRIQALVLMGALCGVAALLGLAFFESADPNIGSGFELEAIAAAVIGGTPLAGGTATIFGAAIGAYLLGSVSSGLVFFNVPINWSSFATGVVIIAAVSIDSVLRSRRRRRASNLGL